MSFRQHLCTPFCAEMLRPRIVALSVAAIGAAQLCASTVHFGMPCFFHRMTGIPCPGCGLTRSVLALLQGHVHDSIRLHPFGPLAFLTLVAALATAIMPG